MADQQRDDTHTARKQDPTGIYELNVSDTDLKEGRLSWADALAELEKGTAAPRPAVAARPQPAPPRPQQAAGRPVAPAPSAPPIQTPLPLEQRADQLAPASPSPKPDETQPDAERAAEIRRPSRYEQLIKGATMKMEEGDKVILDELSDIMANVNAANNKLAKFVKDHPNCVAPNIYRMWEDNLRETANVMLREFYNLRHGQKKKVYEKKYVCKKCHSVFMAELPDGICDECRHKPDDISSGFY